MNDYVSEIKMLLDANDKHMNMNGVYCAFNEGIDPSDIIDYLKYDTNGWTIYQTEVKGNLLMGYDEITEKTYIREFLGVKISKYVELIGMKTVTTYYEKGIRLISQILNSEYEELFNENDP